MNICKGKRVNILEKETRMAGSFFWRISVLFMAAISGLTLSSFGQDGKIGPVSLEQSMPNFTLPVFQGGEIELSQLKGKNVMLFFPRGLSGEDHWCHICNYQYAEWSEWEETRKIREKYNLEILFVLPYSRDMVREWVDKFPDQLKDIENWKNPPEPEKLDERGKQRMDRMRNYFQKSYQFKKGKVPLPFPVLIDAERKFSKGLGIFTTEWSGRKIEQNIPSVYILDSQGIVRFKYISQNTFDRPGPKYLFRVLDCITEEK